MCRAPLGGYALQLVKRAETSEHLTVLMFVVQFFAAVLSCTVEMKSIKTQLLQQCRNSMVSQFLIGGTERFACMSPEKLRSSVQPP